MPGDVILSWKSSSQLPDHSKVYIRFQGSLWSASQPLPLSLLSPQSPLSSLSLSNWSYTVFSCLWPLHFWSVLNALLLPPMAAGLGPWLLSGLPVLPEQNSNTPSPRNPSYFHLPLPTGLASLFPFLCPLSPSAIAHLLVHMFRACFTSLLVLKGQRLLFISMSLGPWCRTQCKCSITTYWVNKKISRKMPCLYFNVICTHPLRPTIPRVYVSPVVTIQAAFSVPWNLPFSSCFRFLPPS